MKLVVDKQHLGQSEKCWATSGGLKSVRPLQMPCAGRIVLVAPHPDDEVFGAAGLIQYSVVAGLELQIVAVTNGESSHPLSKAAARSELAHLRTRETVLGLRRLGVNAPQITRLGLPDGDVGRNASALKRALEEILRPGDLCVAPWRFDGHPDHEICGDVASRASEARGASVLSYLVWAWHWADPAGRDIPWHQCRRLELTRRQVATKRWATHAFQSQIRPISPESADSVVMPDAVMRRFWRRYEIYVDETRGKA